MPTINSEAARSLAKIERFAHLMDSQFRLPGTNFRFGLDPILGLIPVAGDSASFAIQGLLLLTMIRHGASGKVAVLMALNIIGDYLVGSIPILGNVFDFFYRSSDKNLRLLKRHYEEGKYHSSGRGVVLLVVIVLLAVMALLIYLTYLLLHWLGGVLFNNW